MINSYMLDNGIRIVLERIPHFRSASIGIWFLAGSAYEKQSENGISHFIEHMLFKGTKHRSAKQIAEVMDSVGGQLNAYTAKEYTCFYCKVMDEHIDLGLNLLSDMLLNSVFCKDDLEKEKGVILEEIHMYDDSPEDLVHELLSQAYFGQHPLAMPILGLPDRLEQYTREDLLGFMERYYTPDNLVVSAAGNFEEEKLVASIRQYLGNWKKKGSPIPHKKVTSSGTDILFARKEIEQIHLSLAFPGIETVSDWIYPMMILNNALGGGMSSRLFQKIREERGLAYSVFSYPSSYLAGGMYSIYAGMKSSQTGEVLKLILEEISLLKSNGLAEEEFHMAREQLKGNYILGMESTSSRMNSIGKSKLMLGKVMTPAEVIDKINSITPDDVNQVIQSIFKPGKIAAAIVGSEDLTEKVRKIINENIS